MLVLDDGLGRRPKEEGSWREGRDNRWGLEDVLRLRKKSIGHPVSNRCGAYSSYTLLEACRDKLKRLGPGGGRP